MDELEGVLADRFNVDLLFGVALVDTEEEGGAAIEACLDQGFADLALKAEVLLRSLEGFDLVGLGLPGAPFAGGISRGDLDDLAGDPIGAVSGFELGLGE